MLVQCRAIITVNFFPNPYNRYLIVRSWGRDIGCLWWILTRIHVLLQQPLSIILCYIILCYIVLCYITLRYAMLRYITLHYITLHYIIRASDYICYILPVMSTEQLVSPVQCATSLMRKHDSMNKDFHWINSIKLVHENIYNQMLQEEYVWSKFNFPCFQDNMLLSTLSTGEKPHWPHVSY